MKAFGGNLVVFSFAVAVLTCDLRHVRDDDALHVVARSCQTLRQVNILEIQRSLLLLQGAWKPGEEVRGGGHEVDVISVTDKYNFNNDTLYLQRSSDLSVSKLEDFKFVTFF